MAKVFNPRTIVIPMFLAGTRAIIPGAIFILTSPLITNAGVLGDVTAITFCNTLQGLTDDSTILGLVSPSTLDGEVSDTALMGVVIDNTVKGKT